MLTVLDLFSGIGGFSLGLERTGGFKTIAFCEIDPFCRKVLAKHWPGVPCFEDVRSLALAPGFADVICGGFPCQDISIAGKRAGIAGERSGLWRNMVDAVRMVRPRYLIVENVAALLSNGLDAVVGDLAEVRYDCEWHCIPASAIGAPHRRDRWWGIAYPQADASRPDADSAGPHRTEIDQHGNAKLRDEQVGEPRSMGKDVADTSKRGRRSWRTWRPDRGGEREAEQTFRHAPSPRFSHWFTGSFHQPGAQQKLERSDWWLTEPDVGRVAHGVPSRVDRLRSLGNAVVPQIPELIGRAILKAEGLSP